MGSPGQASKRRRGRPTVLSSVRLAGFVAGFCLTILAVTHASATDAEIEYLLSVVAQSDCTFIRNGDEHSGQEAAAHMRKKSDHFSEHITSAESFIEYSATKSLLSGKQYSVNCPGSESLPTGQWLLGKLDAYRKLHGPPPDKAP